ncbi:GEVED domain-containing protein [Chryseobacterium sp. VAUSW3]|uniref:GEVED domain-containing protein n=1 Tax=Chryseobacterium sp. VAUSW3 TaxID=2010998 RepID=UPI000B4C3EDC|nr:GEVED domain-containing protein [Chryseobacterium sp. VAUSW3]OWR15165.1 hypothetical protein CDW55_01670 [Chryseobacterium sp. VAUSW3]
MEKKFTRLIYHGFITCLFFLAATLEAQVTQVFTYTGNTQNFTVPAGVTSVEIKAWGAGGGGSAGSGGSGGFVKATLNVTGGSNLNIVVGGAGTYSTGLHNGGYAGGGNAGQLAGSGGGYSAVFVSTTLAANNVRVLAGGGGGGGYYSTAAYGGPGVPGVTTDPNAGDITATRTGGKKGTAAAGGAAGSNNGNSNNATAGTQLQGGAGSRETGGWFSSEYDAGGGGGGGGYFGGGGGYGSNDPWIFGTYWKSSGGGGGSNIVRGAGSVMVANIAGNFTINGTAPQAPNMTEDGYIAGVGWGGASNSAGGNGLVIITYTLPQCSGNPTAGTAVLNPDSGAAGSSFSATVTGASAGLGITYQWQMNTVATANSTGWTDIPGQTGETASLNAENLPPGSVMYYRRAIICSNSGAIRYTAAVPFTISSLTYCTPTSATANSYYITNVKFQGTLRDTDNTSTFTNGNPRGYQDFTGLTDRAIQEQGAGINVSVKNTRESAMVAWVDWNNDGQFQNSEQVYTSGTTRVGFTVFGFTVPQAQTPGYYRLRIRISDNSGFNSCQNIASGETEDYLFQVIPSCGAAITGVTANQICGSGRVTFNFTAANATRINIYDSETETVPLAVVNYASTQSWQTPVINETHTYYASAQTAVNGCESKKRIKITARVNALPEITFNNTLAEFCGDNTGGQSLGISAGGDKETVEVINENFESGLGVFTNVAAGETISRAYWQRRSSVYVPGADYTVIKPALASGLNGDGFALAITDVGGGSNRLNRLTQTGSFDTRNFLNLRLEFNMYTFFEGIRPDLEYFSVEVSQNNGVSWTEIKKYTTNVGIPNKWVEESLDLSAYKNAANFKLRFVISSFGASNQWSGDIAGVDAVRLYGERPLSTSFDWSVTNGDAIIYNSDCVTPYNGATDQICVRPNADQLRNRSEWTVKATATLGNGCTADGTVTVKNNNKTWDFPGRTQWTTANSWKPYGVPSEDKCVVIRTPVILGASTAGLAKNIRIETTAGATGKLTVNGSLTVTDAIVNTGAATDFIVKSDANLKQINENPNLNTGPISVRRLFTWSGSTDATRREYNFLSSPVYNQNMKEIYGGVASHVPYVTKLNESTNLFVNATAADYTKQGKGFAVREPKTSFTGVPTQGIAANEAEYKGVPNNGTISINLDWTSAGRGYNVVGNPYPSNIDIVKLYANSVTNFFTPEIDANFRFWDNTVNATYVQMGGAYQGYSYAIFNAISETSTAAPGLDPNPGGGNTTLKAPGKIIKVNQAFMIRALQGGASIKFNNTMRETTQTGSVFYGKESQHDRYRLQLSTAAHFVVQNAVTYFPQGSNAFGPEDARIPNSAASDALFTYAGDAKVVINGRSMFDSSDVIPLGTRHFTAGTYRIQAVDLEGVFANGQSIYLKDKALNIFTDLTQGDYTFTSESGEFTNRFEIVYRPGVVLATDTKDLAKVEVYRDAADFVIRSSDKAISYLELYDASGRLIFTLKGSGKELRFAADRLADGMYVLKTTLKDGEVMTAKIRK